MTNISKNARRSGEQVLISRWGGAIRMKSIFKNGRIKHIAECLKTGRTASKPKDLM